MVTLFGEAMPEEEVDAAGVTAELIEQGQALVLSFKGHLAPSMPKVREFLETIRGTLLLSQLYNEHNGKSPEVTILGMIQQAILMTYVLTRREYEVQLPPNDGFTIPC